MPAVGPVAWSTAEVQEWLVKDLQLPEHVAVAFKENAIDGKASRASKQALASGGWAASGAYQKAAAAAPPLALNATARPLPLLCLFSPRRNCWA